MPKQAEQDKAEATGAELQVAVQYPFKVRSITCRDIQKVPGPLKYSSEESGVPYVTLDLDWPGVVTVVAPDAEGAPDPQDPAVIGLAFKALLRWVRENAADVGKEVVADIRLEATHLAQEASEPSIDANEL